MNPRVRPLFELGLVLAIVGLLGGYVAVSRHRTHGRSAVQRCGDNLRQIATAANQYADDHRFLPHFTRMSQVDGDHTTDTAARAMGLLVSRAYLSDPSVFICPDSPDRAPAFAPERVPLTEATDLSYGWTRRGISPNGHPWIVAGDKARYVPERANDAERAGNMRGNHADCIVVVLCDGRTQRLTPEGEYLNTHTVAATTNMGGFLGVLPD